MTDEEHIELKTADHLLSLGYFNLKHAASCLREAQREFDADKIDCLAEKVKMARGSIL